MPKRMVAFGRSAMRRVDVDKAGWRGTFVFELSSLLGFGIFLVGIFFLGQAESSRYWPLVQGTVVSSEVIPHQGKIFADITYEAKIVYKYSYHEEEFTSDKAVMTKFPPTDHTWAKSTVASFVPGTSTDVFINIQNPSETVLLPGTGWGEVFLMLLGAFFFVVGVVGRIMLYLKRPRQLSGESSEE